MITLPGLIDPHVHLREPGATHKEDFDTGTSAALAGGYTVVLAMPNTAPPLTDLPSLSLARTAAMAKARCDYGLFLGAGPDNAAGSSDPALGVCGMKMYLDQTYGPLRLEGLGLLMQHFQTWPKGRPIAAHAEGRSLAAVILLAALHDRPLHVCHVSRKEEILLIRAAKEKGIKISCEVTPHHMFLTQEDIPRLGPGRGEVRPRLASRDDQHALWENLPVIDCFATDHAPHTPAEKDGPEPPPGFPGLETALGLWLLAVEDGRLTLDDLILRMYTNPRRIFQLGEQLETDVGVDEHVTWVVRAEDLHSRCGWSPFEGMSLRGRVRRVRLRGRTAFEDGEILAPAGSGQDLFSPQPIHPIQEVSMATFVPANERRAPSPHLPLGDRREARFYGKDVLSVSQFERSDLEYIFGVAKEMRAMVERVGTFDLLKGKILANLFYEPSTRTSSSFTSAMERLGGSVIPINEVRYSSVAKGESLPDTVRTLECYADVIVLRHPEVGASAEAARYAHKPIINAGDGIGEHPTQALLDLFTIVEELGKVDSLTVTMLGDLKYGRTVHSLARLLSLYEVHLNYVSPEILRMPSDLVAELNSKGLAQSEYVRLEDVLGTTDVLYVTRVQKERFESPGDYDQVKSAYVITPETLTAAKEEMILMHPLPRVGEISMDVDQDPRAAYFRQMEYGLYVRMALLAMVLGKA